MGNPMKIRAKQKGDITEVRVLMSHAMETGLRKGSGGKKVPAHFIQVVTVDIAGKRVIQGQTGTAISKNPVFGFAAKGFKAGDEVVINWLDNKGDKRSDKTVVK